MEAERPPRLIVVDDDPDIVELLESFATERGFEVVSRGSGRAALDDVAAVQPDVAIVDLCMPEVSGLDVLQGIRDSVPACHVIVMTGHTSLDTAVKAEHLGATDYLGKPFEFARLENMLATARRNVEIRRGRDLFPDRPPIRWSRAALATAVSLQVVAAATLVMFLRGAAKRTSPEPMQLAASSRLVFVNLAPPIEVVRSLAPVPVPVATTPPIAEPVVESPRPPQPVATASPAPGVESPRPPQPPAAARTPFERTQAATPPPPPATPPLSIGAFAQASPITAPAARAVQAVGFDAAPGPNTQAGQRGTGAEPVRMAGFAAASAGRQGGDRAGVVKPSGFDDAPPVPAVAKTITVATSAANQTPVEILSRPRPAYTAEARALNLEGEVVLEVEFSADGQARVVRVVSSLGHGLDETATRSAEAIQFRPARAGGQAVDFRTNVTILFRLA